MSVSPGAYSFLAVCNWSLSPCEFWSIFNLAVISNVAVLSLDVAVTTIVPAWVIDTSGVISSPVVSSITDKEELEQLRKLALEVKEQRQKQELPYLRYVS